MGRLARTPASPPASRGSPVNPNHAEINAEAALADPDSVFHHYRRLIELRHTEPVVAHGDFTMLLADDPRVYAFTRRLGDDELLVLGNFSGETAPVELDPAAGRASWCSATTPTPGRRGRAAAVGGARAPEDAMTRRRRPIGLGLAALGRPGYITLGHGARSRRRPRRRRDASARAHAVLDAAYAAGVRYFDAARSYGLAEAFLASWLERAELAADEVGRLEVGLHVHGRTGRSRPSARDQGPHGRRCSGASSRRRARCSASTAALPDPLRDARERRARRRRACSTSSPSCAATASRRPHGERRRQAETIVPRARRAARFDAVQATWNLLERSAGQALARAQTRGGA